MQSNPVSDTSLYKLFLIIFEQKCGYQSSFFRFSRSSNCLSTVQESALRKAANATAGVWVEDKKYEVCTE